MNWNGGRSGGRQLRISLYKLRISEIFISSNSVKSFASSRVRTADLESHSPPLYHRAKLDCCEKKLLFSIYKLSLNSRRSQRFFFDSWFSSWHLSGFLFFFLWQMCLSPNHIDWCWTKWILYHCASKVIQTVTLDIMLPASAVSFWYLSCNPVCHVK